MFIGYFPQEWTIFLNIGALCAVLFGVFLGIRSDVKPFKDLVILLVMIFSLLVSSIIFDSHFLHKFADNGETYPKPLYGCPDLQKYLEATPDFRNPLPSTWKEIIEQPECRSGAIATILVSSALAWGSAFLLSVFFCLMLRFGLNRVRTSTTQEVIVTDTLIAPSSTDTHQDISFEYTVDSLEEYEVWLEHLCDRISTKYRDQKTGWDGHVFRDFILDGFTDIQKKVFKEGFKDGENGIKVSFNWGSFQSLTNRGISKEFVIEILGWKAECSKISMRKLLEGFNMYYKRKNKKKEEFFKDVVPIADKLKSEL